VAWTYAKVAKSVFLLLFATLFCNGFGNKAPPGATQRFSFPGEFSPNFDPEKYGFDFIQKIFSWKKMGPNSPDFKGKKRFPYSQIFYEKFQ
jgi:hypothetical protein